MQHIIFFLAMFTLDLDVDKNFHPQTEEALMSLNSAVSNEHIANEDDLSD